MAPEAFERLREVVQRPERLNLGAIEDLASLSPHIHEADVAQHLEVLRDRGLPQAERHDDVADGPFVEREVHQDFATANFGDGIENIGCSGRTRHGALYSHDGICQVLLEPQLALMVDRIVPRVGSSNSMQIW